LSERFDDVEVATESLFTGICGGESEESGGLSAIVTIPQNRHIHSIADGGCGGNGGADRERFCKAKIAGTVDVTNDSERSCSGSICRLLLSPGVC
jgi:hypothetical protein